MSRAACEPGARAGDGAGAPERFLMDRDLLCTADAEGRFTTLNGAWERVLGWSREELAERPFIDFVHPEDIERTAEVASRVGLPDYELVNFENRYLTKWGEYRWLRWSARSDGEVWFAVAFDVTREADAKRRMRSLLVDDRFVAYRQPISEVAAVHRPLRDELLVRVRPELPEGELIVPDEFVPEAERHGLIGLVDRWMVARAIGLAREGRIVQVNLSPLTLEDESAQDELVALVESAAVPGALIFEVTETAALHHLAAVAAFSERVQRLGCRFALDDWGTGYGSLSYLRELPFSYLKIDGSFVRAALDSDADRSLVRGVVAFARAMGLRTIAEGVEDEATLEFLREAGVDDVQGFLLGRPRPVPALG